MPIAIKAKVKQQKKQVLIVDDNSINRRILGQFLKSIPLEVVEAKSGIEAIELVMKDSFIMIFMDILMPRLNGYQTTKEIRLMNKKIPIIALPSDGNKELTEEMRASGMNDVLMKPFDKAHLKHLLATYVSDKTENQSDALTIFDQSEFEKVYNSTSLQKDIIQTFIDEKQNDLTRIKDAFLTKDIDTIYGAMHYMKGSFSYLKATKILQLTQKILDMLKDKKLQEALELEASFLSSYNEFFTVITTYQSKL